jgi:DNA repair protein RadC
MYLHRWLRKEPNERFRWQSIICPIREAAPYITAITACSLHGLHRASVHEISQQHGMGLAKAAQIKAAIELGVRLRIEAPDERAAIHNPADAAALVQYEMSGCRRNTCG